MPTMESGGLEPHEARFESWKIPNETAITASARMRNMNFTRTGVTLVERSGPQAPDGLGNDDPCGGSSQEDFKCFDHCPVLKPVETNSSRLFATMMSRV